MSRITEIRKSVAESTPVLAVVGATDVVVERVRTTTSTAAARAEKVQADLEDALTTYQVELRKGLEVAQAEVGKTLAAYQVGLDPQRVQSKVGQTLKEAVQQVPAAVQQVPVAVQQVPVLAVSRALEVAGQVETGYAGLAERGKQLVERVRRQKPTQDLVEQGKATLTRTRAAVTTARRAVDDTTAAARSAVTIGRREAGETAEAVEQTLEASVENTERVVAQRTSGTRSATRRTTSTARKGTAATAKAAKTAAGSARTTAAKAAEATESAADKVGD
jgi:heparin binding hemagglutinin HbhA